MSRKNVQFPDQIESTHDALSFFRTKKEQGHNIKITKVGEVQYEVEVPGKGKMHINENCRKLPKTERNFLRFCVFCLGFSGVVAAITFPIWLPSVLQVLGS